MHAGIVSRCTRDSRGDPNGADVGVLLPSKCSRLVAEGLLLKPVDSVASALSLVLLMVRRRVGGEGMTFAEAGLLADFAEAGGTGAPPKAGASRVRFLMEARAELGAGAPAAACRVIFCPLAAFST
mmetsp:Transcript_10296/g.36074  ORF Transcript_10296/g.36074 Transcript_10296/m.36074 type:complete len:126 (-) Transcript_10296:466-843(-)